MILVGDIGGTSARLAIVSPANGRQNRVMAEQDFHSGDFAGLEELAKVFLQQHRVDVECAVFAVAGPVVRGRVELPNLGWILDETQLGAKLDIQSVRLINDLLATAMAVPHLGPESLHEIQPGISEPGGAVAVVAPGTGLGEAFLVHTGKRHHAYPSEGGHSDFAPADALQRDLLEWMQSRFDHVSYERVCSGRGLPNLYAFLKQRGVATEEEWLAAQLAAEADPTRIIVESGIDEPALSPLCRSTLELFAVILAAEAGNAALRVLATGGVYLTGGLVLPLLPILKQKPFIDAFRRKGRLGKVLERVPIYVILHKRIALQGAIQYALSEL